MSSLSHSPLLWLTLTLTCYMAGFWLHRMLKEPLWFPPMLIALGLVLAVLIGFRVPYDTYFRAISSFISCWGRPRWRWRCRYTSPCRV